MKHGARYRRLRESAIVALLSHSNVSDAAKSIGVSTRCLQMWMQRSDFDETLRAMRRDVLSAGASRLAGLVSKAVETLQRCLSSEKDAEAVKSARAVLEYAVKLDSQRLEMRIAELERKIESSPKQPAASVVNVSVETPDTTALAIAFEMEMAKLQRNREAADPQNRLPAYSTNDAIPR